MLLEYEAHDVRIGKIYFRGFILSTWVCLKWVGHKYYSLKEMGISPITINGTGFEGSYVSSGFWELISFCQSWPYSLIL